MLTILGIDPGLALLGFGVLEVEKGERGPRLTAKDYGVIETPKDTPIPKRLMTLKKDLGELFATFQPDCVAIETFFPNPRLAYNAPMVLYARGQVLITAAEAGVSIYEYEPSKVKLNVAGSGKALKGDMQESAAAILNLDGPPRPDDAADALCVALCHFYHLEAGAA